LIFLLSHNEHSSKATAMRVVSNKQQSIPRRDASLPLCSPPAQLVPGLPDALPYESSAPLAVLRGVDLQLCLISTAENLNVMLHSISKHQHS